MIVIEVPIEPRTPLRAYFGHMKPLKACMHVKLATLREKHALEVQIRDWNQLHGSDRICMEKGLKELGEFPGRIGELHEDSR